MAEHSQTLMQDTHFLLQKEQKWPSPDIAYQ